MYTNTPRKLQSEYGVCIFSSSFVEFITLVHPMFVFCIVCNINHMSISFEGCTIDAQKQIQAFTFILWKEL